MSDSYSSLNEIVRNGEHSIAAISPYVGLDPAVNVEALASRHTTVVDGVKRLLNQTGSSRTDLKSATDQRRTLSDKVAEYLGLFYNALVPLEDAGSLVLTRFFLTGGKKDIGRSFADRKACLQRCVDGCTYYPSLTALDPWRSELSTLLENFSSTLQDVSTRNTGKIQDSSGLRDAVLAWKRDYRSLKHIMQGLLIRLDREEELKSLFLDLSTPSS